MLENSNEAEMNDLYESIKDKLEKKNQTLENVIYDTLKYMPHQLVTIKSL